MTKSEMFKAAHTEAKLIVAAKRCSYAEAFMYGLRRVYNKIEKDNWIARPRVEQPKFMWLRGM